MAKVATVEEFTNRYAESTLVSAVRLKRYWRFQGLSEDQAIDRATRQAAGMMVSSGNSLDTLIDLFMELKGACDAFIDLLEQVSEQS